MNAKKVNIVAKLTGQPSTSDQWVKERSTLVKEPTKRLTIDIPESLHRSIKSQCAARGAKIADEVRELLLQKYG